MKFGFGSSGEHRNARGFIVVAVLWILAALSALVLIYLTYVTNTAVVIAASADRVQAEALATAGVELAAYQLVGLGENDRPTSGTFDARVGAGKVTVTFRSEAARVDLNSAPKGLLTGLMVGLGVGPSNAADYADRIVAWRVPTEGSQALAKLAQRSMQLQATVQEGTLTLGDDKTTVDIEPLRWK